MDTDSRQYGDALGQQLDTLSEQLLSTLLAEQTALCEHDIEGMQQTAQHKQSLYAELADVTRQLHDLPDASVSMPGVRALFESIGLLPLWERASERLTRCQQLNIRNGIAIAGCSTMNRQLIDTLLGQPAATDTYSAMGRVDHYGSAAPVVRV